MGRMRGKWRAVVTGVLSDIEAYTTVNDRKWCFELFISMQCFLFQDYVVKEGKCVYVVDEEIMACRELD